MCMCATELHAAVCVEFAFGLDITNAQAPNNESFTYHVSFCVEHPGVMGGPRQSYLPETRLKASLTYLLKFLNFGN